MKPRPVEQRDYDRVGRFYEWLSSKRLPVWKRAQLRDLNGGERVLYVGAGPAFDALAAARAGCVVTCVDLADRMLARAERRFTDAGVRGTFIRQNVRTYRPPEPFDAVVANFFFNLMSAQESRAILHDLLDMVRPGGRLLISDFRPVGRIAGLNHRLAVGLYALFRLAHWQAMHDYVPMLGEAGFEVDKVADYRLRYRSIVAHRPGTGT